MQSQNTAIILVLYNIVTILRFDAGSGIIFVEKSTRHFELGLQSNEFSQVECVKVNQHNCL